VRCQLRAVLPEQILLISKDPCADLCSENGQHELSISPFILELRPGKFAYRIKEDSSGSAQIEVFERLNSCPSMCNSVTSFFTATNHYDKDEEEEGEEGGEEKESEKKK
jgi:hypothetical protein